ncbi:corrinoid protein [Acetivibrio clariflavus]|uniref:Putative cobalamin binding protein n=1 Tax=Acetivibrio clariflavus (strain DSM 19732 / NBRC 101661 / EBR45) TaxID=720554 RepID=G8LYC2_ACECE|nr:corrinoid protein [Acetivibrio clariflavus]AEV68891.1 putative cobalamin binding protein [Acetivibrio clariflavus DSM 19732]
MAENRHELYQKLSDAVVEMDEEKTVELSKKAVADGVDAYEAIDKGLADGMERAGKLFEEEEYFIPELLMCSDAMYAGINVLKPHIKSEEQGQKSKIVIGVVEGDTHDIGKNLVKIMLESAGYEIIDLGRDVAPRRFVDAAIENNADVIALSTLMTTTMDRMSDVIGILNEGNIRDKFKVIVGGGPISQSFADKIGADGYSVNAAEAVRLVKRLLNSKLLLTTG